MSKTFYIIDGHSQIHRAFHARMPDLKAPDGEPTKATYVFTRGLLRMLRTHKPNNICMAMDTPRSQLIRRKLYPEYKADRPDAPGNLGVQIARCRFIVEALGIPVLYANGYEADDIIATLVDAVEGMGLKVVIVSRDKDLMQLVRSNVVMYDPMREEWLGKAEVLHQWGVPPRQVVEVQTLCGDPTDNVPGVVGIGPKTASQLIQRWGTVPRVFRHINDCKPKVQKLLQGCLFNNVIDITRQLVTLDRRVPLDIAPGSLQFHGLDLTRVQPQFKQLGFKRWA